MTTDPKSQSDKAADSKTGTQQTIDLAFQQAVNDQKSGKLQSAEDLYRAILDIQPDHADANHNLGIIYMTLQQPSAALPHLQRALESTPDCTQYWLSYIETLFLSDQTEGAIQALQLAHNHGISKEATQHLEERLKSSEIKIDAASEQSSSLKGQQIVNQQKERFTGVKSPKEKPEKNPSRQDIKKLTKLKKRGRLEAIEAFAIDLTLRYPKHGLGWKTLGSIQTSQGKIDQALLSMQKAVDFSPEDPGVHNDLGLLLNKKARFSEAESHFNKALKIEPDFLPALCNIGNLCRTLGRYSESEKHFRHALRFESSALLHNNLGTTLLEAGRVVDAEACYRQALKLSPEYDLSHISLGVSLRKQGRLLEAIKHQRRALKINPQNTEHFSNLIFTLNYSKDAAGTFLEEAKLYGKMIKKKVTAPFSSWRCTPQPDRLRVGILSGDLYNHPVGFFLESILEKLSSDRVELVGYPTNPITDDLTKRLKSHFSSWKPLWGIGDDPAARLIHSDGIHVLIDLSGHTSHNRLPMLAWKPAPVQVSWLGYFATTGVDEIDFFLADKVGVPGDKKVNFTETVWYLPDTRLCFSRPVNDIPVAPLPALANKHITFGCFQLLTKVNDSMLNTWSEILKKLPDAHLRWQCTQFNDPAVTEHLSSRLDANGIDPQRVSLHGPMSRGGYLSAHKDVDLILDTFPFPGGTTTCEALWMGVPTLTLAGESLLSRQGASLLSAAGLDDWVAYSEAEYIEKAISFASNIEKLASLRNSLRQDVEKSPLFDADMFADNFESALWEMWGLKKPDTKLLSQNTQDTNNNDTVTDDKPVMNFFNPVFWGTKDPETFTDLMRKAASMTTAYHFGDNMFLFQRNNSMLNDPQFMKSWEENAITPPDRTIIWRRYILTMAGFHCQHLEGDFVECGAYQGVGAKTVIDYLGGKDFKKTFWLYDLFEHKEDSVNHPMQAHGPELHSQVVKRFRDYPNVKIFKGFLPDVLEEGCPEKIAYLHLDLNQAPAEIATLDALFDRVVPGGMIILDDYEMVFYRAQKLAEDTWFGKRGYKVFPLPTSQGFVIKR